MQKRSPEKISLQALSIKANSIHFYSYCPETSHSSHRTSRELNNLTLNKYTGNISKKAQARLKEAVSWLLFSTSYKVTSSIKTGKKHNYKLGFITLTLASQQVHSDNEIKSRCLKNFLDVLNKMHDVTHYIWRAEAQGNGNIHFHIIIDRYIHYSVIRRIWNNSQNLLGYVDRFRAIHTHSNPNSTDIHSIKHVRNIALYIAKYCAKDRAFACIGELRKIGSTITEVYYNSNTYHSEEGDKKTGKVVGHIISGPLRKINGRLWYMSKSLQSLPQVKYDQTEPMYHEAAKLSEFKDLYHVQSDFVSSYYGNMFKAAYSESEPMFDVLCSLAARIRYHKERFN